MGGVRYENAKRWMLYASCTRTVFCVRYAVSRAKTADESFLRFWEEVAALLLTCEKEVSDFNSC